MKKLGPTTIPTGPDPHQQASAMAACPSRQVTKCETVEGARQVTVVYTLSCGHQVRRAFRWTVTPRTGSPRGEQQKKREAKAAAWTTSLNCVACGPDAR